MALRSPLASLGPRTRKVLRIAAYVLLALVTFVMALQLTFPFDRVKARAEEALASKYDVTIGGVERGWVPGRVYFNSITLKTRPAKPDDPVSTLFIDRLMIDVGILPLLRGAIGVDIDATLGAGHLRGSAAISKGGTAVSFTGSHLQAQLLPMREVLGLPMSGTIELAVDLDLPNEEQKTGKRAPNWQKAEGGVEFACPAGCTFGDGKTKLKTKLKNARNAAFAADGIEFGTVNVSSMLAKVEIKPGRLEVTRFETKSDDGTLFVDFALDLEPSLDDSTVTGCLRFNGSQALLKREPKTFSAISATGAPLGPDNLFHIKLSDKFKDMKRLGVICSGATTAGGGGSRPTLTVTPEAPIRSDAGVVAPPIPPPPPPVAADAAVAPPPPESPPAADPAHAGSAGAAAGAGTADVIR